MGTRRFLYSLKFLQFQNRNSHALPTRKVKHENLFEILRYSGHQEGKREAIQKQRPKCNAKAKDGKTKKDMQNYVIRKEISKRKKTR